MLTGAPHGPKCCAWATASRKGWKISAATASHSAVRRRNSFTDETPVIVRTMIILLDSDDRRVARTGRDRYPVAPASLGTAAILRRPSPQSRVGSGGISGEFRDDGDVRRLYPGR